LTASPSIALVALTGFGNAVLRALCSAGHVPRFVVTRPESGPYPYYDEPDLPAEAKGLGVDCLFEEAGEARIVAERPALVLVATYHRILGPAIREAPRTIVNLHPSLLPRYRGPNPFFWVLRNGESQTGLTAHELTAKVDSGAVYWQRPLDVTPDDTQGSLRLRLAGLAATAAVELVGQFQADRLAATAQDESKATMFGRPTDLDRTVSADQGVDLALRIARAALPHPGAIVGGKVVRKILNTWRGAAPDRAGEGGVLLALRDGAILFAPGAPS
jgi:methionyl-tRNA formyltransferase